MTNDNAFETVASGYYDGDQDSLSLVGEGPNQLPDRHRINLVDTYQKVTRQTAIYPDAMESTINEEGTMQISALALSYVGLGLGEVGEVQGKLKKLVRDGQRIEKYLFVPAEKREEVVAELGDVMWYVARLADELKIDLSEVLAKNATKLLSRKDRGVLGGSGDNR